MNVSSAREMNDSLAITASSLAITEKKPQRPGGCVGIFFQLFDWNRRFAKKKLFPKKLLSPDRLKQASKKFGGDEKQPKIRLIANENSGGFPNVKNNGMTNTCCESKRKMKAPSLVARLMGLESMPAASGSKPKKASGSEIGSNVAEKLVKSPRNVSGRNASRLIGAATRILEPGLQKSRVKCALTYPTRYFSPLEDKADLAPHHLEGPNPCVDSKTLKGTSVPSCKNCGYFLHSKNGIPNVEEHSSSVSSPISSYSGPPCHGPGRNIPKLPIFSSRDQLERVSEGSSSDATAEIDDVSYCAELILGKRSISRSRMEMHGTRQGNNVKKDASPVTHVLNQKQNQTSQNRERGLMKSKPSSLQSNRVLAAAESMNNTKNFVGQNRRLDLCDDGDVSSRNTCMNFQAIPDLAATDLVGNSLDHHSPGCVLEAAFSTDSYLSSSPNSSSKDKVLAESVDSIDDEPLFPEPDRDLSDCETSLSTRSCRALITDHFNNVSGLLSKIDQLKGSKLSYAKEVILNTELIFRTTPQQQALPVEDGFSVSHFLLNELEMLSSLLWMTFSQLLGCNDPKQMNQLKGFAFDCLLEYLDSKFARYSDSGFRTWTKLPSSMTKEILIADIIEEVKEWTEFVGLIPDELIEWDMSHSLGWIVSTVLAGAFVGSFTGGALADQFGRTKTFILDAIPLAVECSGYDHGISSAIVPLYISEISPTEIRGTLGTVNQLFICIGILAALVAGLPLSGNPLCLATTSCRTLFIGEQVLVLMIKDLVLNPLIYLSRHSYVRWRTMFGISLIPSVLLALGMAFSPESPRWLYQQGRISEAETSIKRLYGIERAAEVMGDLEDASQGSSEPDAGWLDLFSSRYWKVVSIGAAMFLFQQLAGINAVVYYSKN
ncbi:Plastidic glucose transporter 4 [Capsicum baccatum]|uniref:Plastidic glucose transporter 4 n=1 Tax=Capsicum baccatum TaxID=33114 RepID=A0A2G2XGQ8_CAPBA|nr:Plastidic glucose transporter 4 [Capsicum baccatum]